MILKNKIVIIVSAIVLAILLALGSVFLVLKLTKKTIKDNEEGSYISTQTHISVTEEPEIPEEPVDNGIHLSLSAPTKPTTYTTESVFTFSGTSDPEQSLTLNGEEIERDENGIFAHTVNLSNGNNYFTFVHKEKTYKYTINYRYVVINSYSPSTAQIYPSGSVFTVYVEARRGAQVGAKFAGADIVLQPFGEDDGISSFITYTGTFSLPNDNYSDIDMGKIVYRASHNGAYEEFSSKNITCKKPDFIIDYDPDATPSGGNYVNVGSGKVAEIIDYQAETFDANSTNDWSRPTNNYLPKGTMDYASQGYIYHYEGGETKTYILLRYGKQVYTERYDKPGKEYVKVIEEKAMTLPDHNEINIAAFENNGRHSVLTLDCLWKAPFNFEVLPQGYANSAKQDYSVSDVTYNYIDITFCYATVMTGELAIDENHPLFSSAKIIQNESDYTLRLYLKKQGGFYGWDSYYNENGQLVFEFLNPKTITAAQNSYGYDLTGAVILLDVGHGGIDPGAPGFDQKNHNEAIQNLYLANLIKAELESIGATVHLTRTDNSTSTTDDKMTMIERIKPDYCLAIHHNSSVSAKPSGFSSHYFYAFSKKAAEYVYMETNNTGLYDSSKLQWHYYFMGRSSNCPVVLTENGYISNKSDYANIISESANKTKATAITKGIVQYFVSIQ